MHCVYGIGLPTPEKFLYTKKGFPDSQPTELKVDGDGTVSVRASKVCERWRHDQSQPVYMKSIENYEHLDMLQSNDLIDYVQKVALFGGKKKNLWWKRQQ